MLANGDRGPRFESWQRLKDNFSVSIPIFHFSFRGMHLCHRAFLLLVYLYFPAQLACITPKLFLPSFFFLFNSCAKFTNGICSSSLFTIIVSVVTQLSRQNWCCSPPVEAELTTLGLYQIVGGSTGPGLGLLNCDRQEKIQVGSNDFHLV